MDILKTKFISLFNHEQTYTYNSSLVSLSLLKPVFIKNFLYELA